MCMSFCLVFEPQFCGICDQIVTVYNLRKYGVLNRYYLTCFISPAKEKNSTLNSLFTVNSSTVICLTSPFVILGVSDSFCRFYSIFDENPVSKRCTA